MMTTTTKTITVTWDDGKLTAQCDDDPTLNGVIDWEEPIQPGTNSWEVAEAAAAISGAEILGVDHDRNTVFVHVDA